MTQIESECKTDLTLSSTNMMTKTKPAETSYSIFPSDLKIPIEATDNVTEYEEEEYYYRMNVSRMVKR